jgi:cobalt/nickel transport system permease protein
VLQETLHHGHSFFHRRDPRAKILSAAAVAWAIALCQSFPPLILATGGAATALFAAQLPWRDLAKRFAAVNLFLLFLWMVLPWTYGQEHIWAPHTWQLSSDGLRLCLAITLKANAITGFLVVLLATSSVPEIGRGLHQLRLPDKLVFLLLFTYRYIHVIAEEWQRLFRAAQLRGFSPGTNRRTYTTLGHMLSQVFVRSFDRSQRIYQAMLLRGFTGRFHPLTASLMRPADWILALSCIALAGGLVGWEVLLRG